MPRVPTNRPPTHPGEMLVEEFMRPYGLTQVALAERIGVPFQRVNQIINRRRSITPDSALRLSRLFGTTPELWLNMQQAWDLYEARQPDVIKAISQIRPLQMS
jgi:antitoxin HigA-1